MKRFFHLICSLILIISLLCGCSLSSFADVNILSKKDSGKVRQYIYSNFTDMFAVLYEDGTVGIGSELAFPSGTEDPVHDENLDPYLPALQWENVEKIWLNASILLGLHTDGTVSCIWPDYSASTVSNYADPTVSSYTTDHLKNVVDICFMEPNTFVLFLLSDGSVEYVGDPVIDPDPFRDWPKVKKLISFGYDNIVAIHEDGTVRDLQGMIPQDQLPFWTDIRDVFCNGKYYGIKENGSVVICDPYSNYSTDIPNEEYSLAGARTLYPMGDLMFGLTEEGELLVSGGKDWFTSTYIEDYAASYVDFSEFKDIVQLEVNNYLGIDFLLGLRKDGTVVAMNREVNEYLSQWKDIKKVTLSVQEFNGTILICGLGHDGSVSTLEIYSYGEFSFNDYVHVPENYLGWNFQDIYVSPQNFVIGFQSDGSIVGYPTSLVRYVS